MEMEKVYKVYNNLLEEDVFEGTFEEYKSYVLKCWKDYKDNCKDCYGEDSDYFREAEEIYTTIAQITELAKDFIDLFDSLEYVNLNVFGDCVDLEVRDENDNFVWKR